MLDANYQAHFKVLGKLCKLYDDAAADETALELLASRSYDQFATGEAASWPTVLLLAPYASQWSAAITAGAEALQAMAKAMAEAYLKSSTFLNTLLIETPTNTNDVNAILTALAAEMGTATAHDDKTLGTKASTGLVNFFDTLAAEALTWNTEDDSTADYRDAVYVVATIV